MLLKSLPASERRVEATAPGRTPVNRLRYAITSRSSSAFAFTAAMCDVFSSVIDVIERQRMKRARQILDSNVKTAPASRKATQRSTVAPSNRNHTIAGSNARVGSQQRVPDFIHAQHQGDIRKIGPDRRALALRRVARDALPFAGKKLTAGGRVTGHVGLRCHRVPRRDHRCECIDRVGW